MGGAPGCVGLILCGYGLWQAKMAEYSGMVDELGDRARAAEAELGDTQRHAVKLAKALHEEKSKGGRAGHLLAEQRQAMGEGIPHAAHLTPDLPAPAAT